ncbi:hypothetical protein T281_11080 [Rhodomicrobium udaipurense JA643]|uniref:DUF2796 domain-containing protein n=1 Tax=Rhodomicrobium udaipurense TaxID=1202716 RepID=A0A8I1KIE4_9HYPH|nr:DUF2796 domain-containing protein [Rhodomicrobium udaipurense]KAI94419.1 hypothetical protein T281_11080 [Rhodomicrobium udaipurense JA643]MBJ7542547.1 DUF2796 domain-containing protein [Rhodomicrobium udaipurense]
MKILKTIPLAALLAACALTASQAEEHRQLGAHVHGHGKLNIAIEKNVVSIELEAPGADIAGFEHEANTKEDKAKLEKAKATLAKGLELFTPASAAGCKQTSAKVALEAGHEHEGEGKEEHDKHAAEAKDHDHDKGEDHHSEFHAEYAFECVAPEKITSLSFGYFKQFPNAEELDVTVITPKGQSSYEVTKDKPKLEL